MQYAYFGAALSRAFTAFGLVVSTLCVGVGAVVSTAAGTLAEVGAFPCGGHGTPPSLARVGGLPLPPAGNADLGRLLSAHFAVGGLGERRCEFSIQG